MHRHKATPSKYTSNDVDIKSDQRSNGCNNIGVNCKVQSSSTNKSDKIFSYDITKPNCSSTINSTLLSMSSSSSPSSSSYSDPNSPENGTTGKKCKLAKNDSDCDFKVTSSGSDSAVHSYSASPTSSMGKSSCNSADEVDSRKVDHSQHCHNAFPALTVRRPDRAGRIVLVESGAWTKLFRDCGTDEKLRVMDELIRQLRNLKNQIEIRVELDDDQDEEEEIMMKEREKFNDEIEMNNTPKENREIITVKQEDISDDTKLDAKSSNDSVPSTPNGQEGVLFSVTDQDAHSPTKSRVSCFFFRRCCPNRKINVFFFGFSWNPFPNCK